MATRKVLRTLKTRPAKIPLIDSRPIARKRFIPNRIIVDLIAAADKGEPLRDNDIKRGFATKQYSAEEYFQFCQLRGYSVQEVMNDSLLGNTKEFAYGSPKWRDLYQICYGYAY